MPPVPTPTNNSFFYKLRKNTALIFVLMFFLGIFIALGVKNSQAGFITFDIPTDIKEFIVKPIVRKIANQLANQLANRVYEKVSGQTDEHEPFFVLSWRNLILESQGRGNDVFRSMLQGSDICPHIRDNLITAFGADFAPPLSGDSASDESDDGFRTYLNTPGTEPFDLVSQCSLDFDLESFNNDFTQGGWGAWNQLIQPQNNFLGFYSNAVAEKDRQEQLDKDAAVSQAIAGQGFLPNRTDVDRGRGGGPSGCAVGSTNRCTIFGRTLSPEKLFGETAARSIDVKLGSYYDAQEFTDVVIVLFNSIVQGVMGRLTDFSGFDVAKFAEEQFEADRADGESDRQAARGGAGSSGSGGSPGLQSCLSSCGSAPIPVQCDQYAFPDDYQRCSQDAVNACRARCYLNF